MARRRSRKSKKHRSKRRNPSRSHKRRRTRSHGKRHGRRRHRRNPGGAGLSLRSFSPGSTLKSLTSTAIPVVVGYLGVNLTWWAARTILEKTMGDRWAALSPGARSAVEAGVCTFVGVPVATFAGSKLTRGKGQLVAAGALANAGIRIVGAVAGAVPGIPSWVQSDLLGAWPGGSGVYDYMTAAQQPQGMSGFGPIVRGGGGVSDYMTLGGRSTSGLPAIAGGGRGAF